MVNPSQINAALTLAAVLVERGSLATAPALAMVRSLAVQAADLHAAGMIHGALAPSAVLVEDQGTPRLETPAPGTVLQLDGDWAGVIPELPHLAPINLPARIDVVSQQFREAGISLDPRQIDLCQLGALWCRLLTGESVAKYLRSPRVKGLFAIELRRVLERMLGIGGCERFADMQEFLGALNAAAKDFEPPPTIIGSDGDLAEDAATVAPPPAIPTGDTTPSIISSLNTPADTSVADVQRAAANPKGSAADNAVERLPFARLGHYEIVRKIGHGGMGDVYLGYEASLDRHVAIKVLPADLARSDDFVRRFRTEATAVAKLNHPNIVPIHFIGEELGHHFYVMQYVEGESLAERLDRVKQIGVAETLAIVEQALAGLNAAHERGMVHRDIKPGNILLDSRSGRALLADFGLVKSLESAVSGKTATGVVMGTVDYISPEQGRGRAVDHRSDLYSIGVLLFRMLSGHLPFTADSPTALIFQHVYEPPPDLQTVIPDVPVSLAQTVTRLLAKSPSDRYQTTSELIHDLHAIRSGQPLEPAPLRAPSATPTVIVRLPTFDEDPPELAGLQGVAPQAPNWWDQARGRAVSIFRRNAPEALLQLQNTQQQVDGAVAVYERRQRELQKLADTGESVLLELNAQAHAQRTAARKAEQRAAAASESAERERAGDDQAECARAADELERQAADQRDELGSIRLRLAQARARVQELQNQRDILNARLLAARAERHVATGAKQGSKGPLRKLGSLALRAALVVAVGIGVFLIAKTMISPRPDTSTNRAVGAGPRSANGSAIIGPTYRIAGATEKRLALSRDGTKMAISRHVTPTSSGKSAASSKTADEIKLWDLAQGSEVLAFEEPHRVLRMAISPDGRYLLSVGSAPNTEIGEFKIWDLKTGKVKHRQENGYLSDSQVGFSPDGKSACLPTRMAQKQSLNVFDVDSKKLDELAMAKPDEAVSAFAISPVKDIAALAVSQGRFAIDIYDLHGRKTIDTFVPPHNVKQLAFSGDGRLLIGLLFDSIVAWDTSSWSESAAFPLAEKYYDRMAVSNEGRLVACQLNGQIDILDLQTKKIVPLQVPYQCLDVAFSLGGTLIVAAEEVRFAYFDPATGKEQLLPKLKTAP